MRTAVPSAEQQTALDQLQERVGPVIAQTVDAPQVAALLEADGITDDLANRQFGFTDVFALADELRRRALPQPLTPVTRERWYRWTELADRPSRLEQYEVQPRAAILAHGLLYLVPAALFPALIALLDRRSLVLGLVVGAGLAWVWAGVACWWGYQLLGANRADRAARVLRTAAWSGLPAALLLAAGVTAVFGSPRNLIPVAVMQMAYQMGVAILVFFGHELRVTMTMVPAVLTGAAYLVTPSRAAAVFAVTVGAACVAAVLLIAVRVTRAERPEDPRLGRPREPVLRPGVYLIAAYSTLSAAFLLIAQSRFMTGSLDVALGMLPLVTAMGVVELRARQFRRRARNLMARVRYPRELAIGVRWLLATDLTVCFLSVGLGGAVLSYLLNAVGEGSGAGVVMTLASMFLAGAYYSTFLLSGLGRLAPLCLATGACLAGYLAVLVAAPRQSGPWTDTLVFAGTSFVLLLLLLALLLPTVSQPRAHA